MSGARRRDPPAWRQPDPPQQQVTATEPAELPVPAGCIKVPVYHPDTGQTIDTVIPDPLKRYLQRLCG
jgi:hypothetical protein